MDGTTLFGKPANFTTGDPPKKRGRPPGPRSEIDNGPGSEDSGTVIEVGGDGTEIDAGPTTSVAVEPESATGGENHPEKKRRGRKPGSTVTKAEAKGLALDAKDLAPKIQGLHVMLAMMTNQPIFAISEGEAKLLASSIVDVSSHYNIGASSKTMSIVGLIAVCGMIYVPKVVMLKKAQKDNTPVLSAAPALPDNIMPMPASGRLKFE